ncbi:MAG: polysaccharide deacetylase family protein [Candidatus Omnitrophica bacterium]|nr:polysaccharide deacetylase family protein [Candidatus Omnitrophota bacterium]
MNVTERLSDAGLAIFLFHGVVEKTHYAVRNYTRKHLKKSFFYELMRTLKKRGNPLSMDEVVKQCNVGRPFPLRSFAVTFDDGFENNYSVAAPILKDLGIPATFYITTDFIENNTMSWIDRIEYCLGDTLEGSLVFPWTQTAQLFRTVDEKKRILENIRSHVKRDASIDVAALVSSVFSQCGLKEIRHNDDPLDLKMDWEQVQELGEDKNFIIGGHSHTHKILSFLNQAELDAEIKSSVEILKQKAGVTVRHYSYPEGLQNCYSEEVIGVLKHYGIVCCPSAEDGINYLTDSLFHLKRITIVG